MTVTQIVVLGVVALAALAAAELIARAMLHRSGYYVWRRYYRRFMPVDPVVSPHLASHADFAVNSDGERAPQCPSRPDLFRILVAGGSAVECADLGQASTWSARMQARLNRSDALRRLGAGYVHVGNVGKSGLDARAVREVIQRTPPRALGAIVLMIGAGNLVRWLENAAPPDATFDPLPLTRIFDESPTQHFGFTLSTLALAELRRRVLARWLQPLDARVCAAQWRVRARRMRHDAQRFITEIPDATRFLDIFEAEAEAAVVAALARADRVLIAQHPRFQKPEYTEAERALFWMGGIGNAYRGDVVTTYFSTEVLMALLDRVDERLRAVAHRHGVRFVETQSQLPMSAESFIDCFHLTTNGAEVVGRVISDALLEP